MDLKLARALQQQILGPGWLPLPCGCRIRVDGYFPKKPWVHFESTHVQPSALEHVAHCEYLKEAGEDWINKETFKRVPREEFEAAWSMAKKVVSMDGRWVVKMSRYYGARTYTSLEPLITGRIEVPKPETWQPKLGEVMRWK